ncbi:MAG: hypothetical protein M3O93_07450, partial [Chloroflexota bacterium]|nr:hypothetical protein [Chloroflexota bacterium]
GTTWWSFDEPYTWPPPDPNQPIIMPYSVAGVLTLTSPDKAVFRADVNGARLGLTRTATRTGMFGCI